VLTPNWRIARWCFAELTLARALGKLILPIVCEPLGEPVVLPEIQSIDLLDWNADGLDKLERRLRAITNELARGFKLDPNRPPFPGIHAFEAEDAAIYFGRDDEARAVIERLDASVIGDVSVVLPPKTKERHTCQSAFKFGSDSILMMEERTADKSSGRSH
jgi:hypothetical protein